MAKSYMGGGKDFELPPEGLHQAVCVDVVDLGLVEQTFEGKTKEVPKIRFFHALADEESGDGFLRDEDGRLILSAGYFTNSLADSSKLLPHLNAWLGKPIPDEVRKSGFDLDNMIGRNSQQQIAHNAAGNGKTYANIIAILPIAKSTKKLGIPDDYVRVQDREGYVPPRGSERWYEQQEANKGVDKGGYPGDDNEEEDDPFSGLAF